MQAEGDEIARQDEADDLPPPVREHPLPGGPAGDEEEGLPALAGRGRDLEPRGDGDGTLDRVAQEVDLGRPEAAEGAEPADQRVGRHDGPFPGCDHGAVDLAPERRSDRVRIRSASWIGFSSRGTCTKAVGSTVLSTPVVNTMGTARRISSSARR
ncbi:hypothetical protein AEGHOMDF_1784 [Methylobacterium soli]|nr:hypothetical protein AEGHOMDF_1784 [Methylobacterium soli]